MEEHVEEMTGIVATTVEKFSAGTVHRNALGSTA
jgi:hypothetical protein